MAKRKKLPPMEGSEYIGDRLDIASYTVGSFTSRAGEPPESVGITLNLTNGQRILMRFTTPNAVDRFISLIERHKFDVWPETR